jgi:hypothetical protein
VTGRRLRIGPIPPLNSGVELVLIAQHTHAVAEAEASADREVYPHRVAGGLVTQNKKPKQ